VAAANLSALGAMAREQGDSETARLRFEECLFYWRQVGRRQRIAGTLLCLAALALDRADWGEAQARFAESLLMHRELGLPAGIAVCLEEAGRVARARGQLERAARLLGASDALCAATRSPMVWPFHDPADRERHVSAIRAGLGGKAFVAAYAEGKGLSLEQAIGCAFEETEIHERHGSGA
jgi:non-specific serine/threonine protein kinase